MARSARILPSCALVPLPNSSMRQSERWVVWRKIWAICERSSMKADCATAAVSFECMRVWMASVRATVAASAGTKEPTCAR